MYNNLKSVFGCLEDEDQYHIFVKCEKIKNNLIMKETVDISHIYVTLQQQIEAAKILTKKKDKICLMVQILHQQEEDITLPGGDNAV